MSCSTGGFILYLLFCFLVCLWLIGFVEEINDKISSSISDLKFDIKKIRFDLEDNKKENGHN